MPHQAFFAPTGEVSVIAIHFRFLQVKSFDIPGADVYL
jgi:hypothetical protein